MLRISSCLLIGSALAMLGAGEPTKPFKQTADEIKVFELTNQERKKKDAKPLKLNAALSKIARAHSENMARQDMLEHELDKKGPADRVTDAKYKWRAVGENILLGRSGGNAERVIKTWMDSQPHADNILSEEFTEIGVGMARDEKNRLFYTQVFAKPR